MIGPVNPAAESSAMICTMCRLMISHHSGLADAGGIPAGGVVAGGVALGSSWVGIWLIFFDLLGVYVCEH